MTRHGSIKFTGSNPNKVPDGVGDFLYEQDRIRDYCYLLDRTGMLGADLFASDFSRGRPCDGWIVTDDGSHAHVNISAGYGYAPVSVSLGQDASVPPATADETVLVRVSSGALTGQGTFTGTGLYYVKMSYMDADALSRVRARAGGSWYFAQDASYALSINTYAPVAGEVLLATVYVAAGVISAINQNAYESPGDQYDLIVDSDAKLDAWCRATDGHFRRVFIRAGTWTASALSPTAGMMLNLTAAGTVKVVGEIGSVLAYSGSSAGIIYGMAKPAHLAAGYYEEIVNVTVNIFNSGGVSIGFYNLSNLKGCAAILSPSSGNSSRGFEDCCDLFGCRCSSSAYVGGGASIMGYELCRGAYECHVAFDDIGSSIAAVGFQSCTSVIGCKVGINGSSSGNYFGISTCSGVSTCEVTLTKTSGGNITGITGAKCVSSCRVVVISGGSGEVRGLSTVEEVSDCTVDVGPDYTGSTGAWYGAHSCKQVSSCSINVIRNTSGAAYGMYQCVRASSCTVTMDVTGVGAACAGYSTCDYLSDCNSLITKTGNGGTTGFLTCTFLNGCSADVNYSASTGNCQGFNFCTNMTQCKATSNSSSSGSSSGIESSSYIGYCSAVGLNSGSGSGYGYVSCTMMGFNGRISASKTATFQICYADLSTQAPALTAAGGYNNPS